VAKALGGRPLQYAAAAFHRTAAVQIPDAAKKRAVIAVTRKLDQQVVLRGKGTCC